MSRIIANNIRHNDATADSLSFDSNARVGIGTSNPTHPLTIKPSSDVDQLYLQQSNVNDSGWKIHANASAGDLVFFRQGSGTDTRRLAFREDGGIMFGSDTAAANALDDYEEGSWTPTILITNTEVAAYAAQTGRYRKIGDMVVAMCNVGVNGNQTGGNTGSILVGGLPFTATALNIATTVHTEGLSNLTTQSIMFQLDSGQTRVALRSFTSGTFSALTHSNIQGSGFQGFNFVATYLT